MTAQTQPLPPPTRKQVEDAFAKQYGYEPDQAVDEDVEDFNIFMDGYLAALTAAAGVAKPLSEAQPF